MRRLPDSILGFPVVESDELVTGEVRLCGGASSRATGDVTEAIIAAAAASLKLERMVTTFAFPSTDEINRFAKAIHAETLHDVTPLRCLGIPLVVDAAVKLGTIEARDRKGAVVYTVPFPL